VGWEIGPEPSFTPRGNSSCFSNSILIMHMFRRIQIPENCRCRYPISVCNEPGNESIPRSFGDHHTCFCDHLTETWLFRGGPGVWPSHTASTYIEGTCETLSWSSHRPPCLSPSLKCYSISVLWKNPRQNSYAQHTHSSDSMRRGNILSIYNKPSRLD